VGVVDSAGLLAFPNRPPPVEVDGVEPNKVFCCVFCVFCVFCAFDPKKPPPVVCVCAAPPNNGGVEDVVADVDGVVDEVVAVFIFPKRPPGFCAVCPK
jgi:hypothetical protein